MKRLAGWETIVALMAAFAAALFAREDLYAEVTGELVTVLSLLMAAVIPTMILASTALRAGHFSVSTIRALAFELNKLISLFGGLFLYTLATSALIIFSRAFAWRNLPGSKQYVYGNVDLGSLLTVTVTFLLVFLLLRAIAVTNGVRSILRLSANLAEAEAKEREAAVGKLAAEELATYETPKRYGDTVVLPH